LKEAVGSGDSEKLIRYVRLHFGDGDEAAGRAEIDIAWIEALKLLLDVHETKHEFIFALSPKRTRQPWRTFSFTGIYILSGGREIGFTMENFNETNQLRPGLWATVNERYPGARHKEEARTNLAIVPDV
jgi:hypothetical protein